MDEPVIKRKAWVLWHMYGDGSGAHVERVYNYEFRAKQDLALVQAAGSAHEWRLDEVGFIA